MGELLFPGKSTGFLCNLCISVLPAGGSVALCFSPMDSLGVQALLTSSFCGAKRYYTEAFAYLILSPVFVLQVCDVVKLV